MVGMGCAVAVWFVKTSVTSWPVRPEMFTGISRTATESVLQRPLPGLGSNPPCSQKFTL